MRSKKILTGTLLIISGIFLAYIWYGFLFPDPYFYSLYNTYNKIKFLWIPRIFIPLIYLVVVLIIAVKNKRLSRNLASLLLAFLLLFLIIYPLLELRYYFKSQNEGRNKEKLYHPYLQLVPNDDARLNDPKFKSSYKIFCLGGSTTEFKDTHGIGWPDRLEIKLREKYHTDSITVYNFGKQWYTSLHSLINYEANLRQYKPDLIILMHNINDLLNNADFSYLSKGSFRNDYGHFYGPSAGIFEKNGLLGFFISKFRTMWYYRNQRMVFEQDTFPGLVPFTRNIQLLIDLASMDHSKVILLTQPNIYTSVMDEKVKKACMMVNFEAVGKQKKWGFHTAYVGMQQYNNRIKEISTIKNVNIIDLEKHIPKTLKFFYDEVHYNDTTFDIISRVLADEIVRLKVLPFKTSDIKKL